MRITGEQWAYTKLIAKVYEGDIKLVEQLAMQYTEDTREEIMGMALADIDDCVLRQVSYRPYQVLVRVLDGIKLRKESKT